MANYFVACGGTGAHVMLAMVRLHLLGYPFGFFKDKRFPDLFLIDQDDGGGTRGGGTTAWEEVKKLLEKHSGRYDPKTAFGFNGTPNTQTVMPLPVGEDGSWYEELNGNLAFRFNGVGVLPLITSEDQRRIEYSRGMMGSPAVGSLLFSLKEYDQEESGQNFDKEYRSLLEKCSSEDASVVVCGSIVGGTGASVAPTLADRLSGKASKVMAVLVHQWFELDEEDKSNENHEKSRDRNLIMRQNAACGLAYSGKSLATSVATVLVGGPSESFVKRKYSGDNQQENHDSYLHVVAALAGLIHLFQDPKELGLYGVSGSSDQELTTDIRIGGSSDSTLGALIEKAKRLSNVLEIYCEALEKYVHETEGRNWIQKFRHLLNFGFIETHLLKVYEWVLDEVGGNSSKFESVCQELRNISEGYKSVLNWLKGLMSDRANQDKDEKWRLYISQVEQLRETDGTFATYKPRHLVDNKGEFIALTLFHWIATWVQSDDLPDPPDPIESVRGYWPLSKNKTDGLRPSWENPSGSLSKIDSSKISECLKDYFDLNDISPNGWPHPIAVAKQFQFLIENNDELAVRKLELLLVGHALNILELREVKFSDQSSRDPVSIETLIEKEYPNLAKYSLVYRKKTYGFSSPDTLLCPTQDVDESDWRKLWDEITSYTQTNSDWKTASEWGASGRKVRGRIALWVKGLKDQIPQNSPKWLTVLNQKFEDDTPQAFGASEWLNLPDDISKRRIPLPIDGWSQSHPSEEFLPETEDDRCFDATNQEDEIIEMVPGFNKYLGFERIKKELLSSLEYGISFIWKEHLDELQKAGQIFVWGANKSDDRVWIVKNLREDVIWINNLRVIDVETIQINRCVPLRQRPVPGSDAQQSDLKFPDLPLIPEYVRFARVFRGMEGEGDAIIDQNWKGLTEWEWDQKSGKVTWDIHLLGRPHKNQISINLGKEPELAEAHWMVWPNFKSNNDDEKPWRAYYIYEHSTKKSLEAQVMVADREGRPSKPKGRPSDPRGPGRTLEFSDGQHTGNAPVAFCAYDQELEEHMGIYAIKLTEYETDDKKWKLAIDFGTSHTVAAKELGGESQSIPLRSELGLHDSGLTLHISENWPDESTTNGKDLFHEMQLDLWRPTYIEEGRVPKNLRSVLRSDLWSLDKPKIGEIPNLRECWEPVSHYTIPPIQLNSNLREYVISDFKWKIDEDQPQLMGEESWLQEIYLGMVLEIFIAEVARDRQRLPSEIEFTFTYPLRGNSDGSTDRFEKTIKEKVLRYSEVGLGCKLNRDHLSLYSESHSAADLIGTKTPFEVKLVADLGGGTLDIFISTSDVKERDSRFVKQVADSAKLGANNLLKILVEGRDIYLPKEEGWQDYNSALPNLHAWMRSEGSSRLFKMVNTENEGLRGFQDKKDSNNARALIERYFRLIVDFLARSLVAYVVRYVWPKLELPDEQAKLKLIVQLRGNGWRLWYDSPDYHVIQRTMVKWIKERADELWKDVDFDEQISALRDLWDDEESVPQSDPKLAPICNAVGKSMNPNEAEENSYKFPLSKVRLLAREKDDDEKCWSDSLPFEGVPSNYSLRIREFSPPLSVHPPHDTQELVTKLENERMNEINKIISEEVRDTAGVDAPIAAAIWENMLRSAKFKNNEDS